MCVLLSRLNKCLGWASLYLAGDAEDQNSCWRTWYTFLKAEERSVQDKALKWWRKAVGPLGANLPTGHVNIACLGVSETLQQGASFAKRH
jgi:hypothetical protein